MVLENEEESQVSDDEIESESPRDEKDVEGNICIKLTKVEKLRIKKKWSNTLIVKVFGKSVGFQHLSYK
ncbi:hypothetical protein J1N35_020804 [Gossypium stocksii]|uniref:Uncharacterized protein n=1 Tax=Gossypium stocksii TaxID=47602 RepID=A0A9D3VDG9_9ROSI|nr:hypothetical protein J1N35_020804 [Gossypium stocksii]